MTNSVDQKKTLKLMLDGFITGCASTALFNPLDKAIFLMVKDKKTFFDPSIWKNPYQGSGKALYSRVVGYGVYLSFFDIYSEYFKHKTPQSLLFASLATGLNTVALSHCFNILKMYQWSHKTSDSIFKSTKLMAAEYGWRVFFRALPQTCARDCLFSTTYFLLSDKLNKEKNFGMSTLLASSATALSSPLNYLRSRQFFDFKESPTSISNTIEELSKGMKAKPFFSKKISYIFHERLNIGFGTLRVGLGMAVADKIYHFLKSFNYP